MLAVPEDEGAGVHPDGLHAHLPIMFDAVRGEVGKGMVYLPMCGATEWNQVRAGVTETSADKALT